MATSTTLHSTKPPPLDISALERDFKPNEEEAEHGYNPFHMENFQRYQPLYSKFFSLSEATANKIALNHKYHIQDMHTVLDIETEVRHERPIFIKYSPLVDPLRYLIGKYSAADATLRVLPTVDSAPPTNPKTDSDSPSQTHPKFMDINNASYTDNFFSFLTSKLLNENGIVNCIDYYGSYLGVQRNFKINIADDLDYLTGSSYFLDNKNKIYTMDNANEDEFANFGSRTNKQRLRISESDIHNLSVSNLSVTELESDATPSENLSEVVYENNKSNSSSSISSCDSLSEDEESEDSEGSDDEEESEGASTNPNSESDWETESSTEGSHSSMSDEVKNAYIRNFPVQLICLEKCDGTLDELFMKDILSCEQGIAALMQVIMTLLTLQKCFHFTHNDLHTNNIMYVNTDIEHIDYVFQRKTYRVPTYGRIFKLIDFGRSIYKFQGHTFCSDSFAPGGDAATQYNSEPYLNDNKPRIDPNFSFDLCRLGSSIYDFVIDEDLPEDSYDDLQKVVDFWCLDDTDKNVLYKKNGDERYPGFKLYKMIARNVHRHTPEAQLDKKVFQQFLVTAPGSGIVMNIDALPVYV
jgi:hypothetical protein